MRLFSFAIILFLAACGQAPKKTVDAPADEPAPLTAQPNLVGEYDVAFSSENPNCVWNDSTWTVDRTQDTGVYRVNTAAQVSYVPAADVPHADNAMAWSVSRYYTVNGCFYRVSFDYKVGLDADGNLDGTVAVKPDASCGPATRCEYAITSQRITADSN